jgi:hypothetical protein
VCMGAYARISLKLTKARTRLLVNGLTGLFEIDIVFFSSVNTWHLLKTI